MKTIKTTLALLYYEFKYTYVTILLLRATVHSVQVFVIPYRPSWNQALFSIEFLILERLKTKLKQNRGDSQFFVRCREILKYYKHF